MTGCQEKNSDFFLKLPLKELQNLCKTHDLPTNKTRVKLANSLASFFKKKNAYTSSLEDRSSSPVKASYTIPLSESQCKETAHPLEEGRRGAFEARTNSSECDSCKLTSGIKVVGADRSHCQVGIQPYNSAEGVVCRCPPHSCCAISEPVIGDLRHLVTADAQGNTRNTEVCVGCHGAVTRNVSCDPSPSKIVGQEMSDNVTADHGPKQVVTECSTGSKLLSSDDIKTKALSSFEFSVYVEEGINLHVDLNSNMSEYINDMIILQKAQHQNLWDLSNHVRGLADTGKHTEVPSSGISVGLQNGVERKCTNSSLSSADSKSCHSEGYVPDRTAVISGSAIVTKNGTPIKIVGCSDENQMISTSSITCFNAQEPQLASDVISGPGKSEVVPQNSVDASRMETANSSVLDTLKPIPAVDVLNPDGNKNHDPRDGLVTTSIDSDNVEASSLCNIAASFEQGVNIPDGRKLETSDIHNNDSTLCQVPMEKGATESLGTSENHLPSRQIQHVCGDHENSVAKESISAINADLGGCIAAKEIESSKCLESQSSPVRRPKRSYHSEFPSKSQHANSKNKRTMSLRSAKALEREPFPRRSTRHIK